MLVQRSPRAGAAACSEPVPSRSLARHVLAPKWCMSPVSVVTCGRVLTVAACAKKDNNSNTHSYDDDDQRATSSALQAYVDRERFLLSELAAARGQVDKLLDQQRVLLDMVARLSGLGASSSQLPPALTSLQPPQQQLLQLQRPISPATAAAVPPAAPPSPSRPPSSSGSTSPEVPALASLADLFKSAAAAAAPHPASAAAAASIAAAISAVDEGDILTINSFNIPAPGPAPTSAPPPAAPSSLAEPSLLFDTLGGFTAATAAPTTSAAPEAAAAAPDLPVEVSKAAPTDPPPELVQGDDDIFWLSRLHSALEKKGYFPGDDDMDNWYFGEGTLAAVLAFQASERLPETGVVDRPTWTALLGAEEAEALYARGAPAAAPSPSSSSSTAAAASSTPAPSSSVPRPPPSSSSPSIDGREVDLTKWPVLMEGDGGREVHALQAALANNGFHCGEDDMRWWQFGDATLTALKYFQSCSSLPESGVCDELCWRALLGAEATPSDVYKVRLAAVNSDEEDGGYEDDMDGASQGRVWLLGEQRWERRAS